jgi:hypothetical protein
MSSEIDQNCTFCGMSLVMSHFTIFTMTDPPGKSDGKNDENGELRTKLYLVTILLSFSFSKYFKMHLNHSSTSTLLLLLFARAMEASPSSFRGLVSSSISRSLSDPRDNHEAMVLSKKQVVFFAGPHGAASGQMESFFSLFDNNAHHKKHGITKALIHWAWPLVQDEPFDVFDRLVTEPDNQEFKEKLLTTVSQRFEESENGIIVGTAQFDEVGADAIYDGLTAMKEIVSLLNLEDSDVTVVVNYKAPRLDQWISAWKHEKGEVETSTYEDFLCLSHNKEEEKRKRFNMLGCQMNPLGISKIFLDQGWKVHLIDMEGVENAERDVAHTIGCRILMGQCTDGFLGGDEHGGCRHDINHIERPFDALDDVESSKIEELFRNRDCGYKPLLEKNIDNGNLIIEYQDSLWEDCDPDRKEYYEGLLDATDTLYVSFKLIV